MSDAPDFFEPDDFEPEVSPLARPVAAGLYVVATPIGNLRDITLRALDVLKAASLILCEDTRVTGKLLSAFGLKAALRRSDEHTEAHHLEDVCARIQRGEVVAMVSDAGTPLISDPGYVLVRGVIEKGLKIIPVPGASSLTCALSASGLAVNRVLFSGFLPPKTTARQKALSALKEVEATLVFFESGPRIKSMIEDCLAVLGDRQAVVARELTKLYESFYRGSLSALSVDPALSLPKGEIVVMIAPPSHEEEALSDDELMAHLNEALLTMTPSEAAKMIAKRFHLAKKTLYDLAVGLKNR